MSQQSRTDESYHLNETQPTRGVSMKSFDVDIFLSRVALEVKEIPVFVSWVSNREMFLYINVSGLKK